MFSLQLKQVVCSTWSNTKSSTQHFDVFMRNCDSIEKDVPCTVEIMESFTIPVSKWIKILECMKCIRAWQFI